MSGGMVAADVSGKADTVLTTKGDLASYSTLRARLGIGSNDQVLTADSAEALGLKWAPANEGKLEVLEVHTTTASATKTFTITEDFSTISKLVLVYNISAGAPQNLQLKVNGITNYNIDGRRINNGTETLVNSTGATEIKIDESGNLPGAGSAVMGTVEIILPLTGTTRPIVQSYSSGGAQNYLVSSSCIGTETSITSIEIKVSTSTWQAGGYMVLYGVKR